MLRPLYRRACWAVACIVLVALVTSLWSSTAAAASVPAAWADMPVARAGGRTPGATLRATSITPLGYTGELKSLVNTGYLSADDTAIYLLWVFPGQTLDIRLSTTKDFLLALLDENGDPLAVSDRVFSGTESITYGYNDYGYGPQVMMIGVGAYQAGSYTLRVSMTDPPVDSRLRRIAGSDRYLTAVAASQDAFPEGADTVVIATGANFPDALSAAGLCGVYGAPLLLVPKDTLPAAVSAEIDRLGATQAFIVGGTGVVGESVETALNGKAALSGNVHRISGLDRYETARKVAEAMHGAVGAPLGNAIVVCGTNFADALAASPLSYADRRPILLTPPTYAHPQMLGALASIEATNVVIVGGTGAVGSMVETALEEQLGISDVPRWAGLNRFETAAAVAEHCIDAGILTRDFVGYAWGRDFPDGLAGGVAAGKADGALLLTESWVEPESTQFFNFDCAGITTTARVFGGPGVVWGSVLGMVNDDLFGGF